MLVTLATIRTHARASVLCPVKTGVTRAQMGQEIRSGRTRVRGTVYNDSRIAMLIHEGSPPHEIRPRVRQALWWEGADHPVSRVSHPGTAARPFLARALFEECTPLGFRVTRLQ